MLLSLRRGTSGHVHWINLRPMHHGLRKRKPRPLKARRALHGVNPERRLPQLLHKAKVRVRNWLGGLQLDTEAFMANSDIRCISISYFIWLLRMGGRSESRNCDQKSRCVESSSRVA
jgi:hypothetical protein